VGTSAGYISKKGDGEIVLAWRTITKLGTFNFIGTREIGQSFGFLERYFPKQRSKLQLPRAQFDCLFKLSWRFKFIKKTEQIPTKRSKLYYPRARDYLYY
jgi:hypothetical protein